ncbi:MAG: hypothetical protein Kow0029_09140 [Candidatus Rifleibacteriota bacterium]
MFRRIRMALPLVFAFVLTLLPFLLLEFTQYQRNEMHAERDLYLWEQEANNYLQIFSTLWTYESQTKRRLNVFRKHQGYKILNSLNKPRSLADEIKKRFPASWLPVTIYAGEYNLKTGKFKLFSGEPYSSKRRRVFETILSRLAADTMPEGSELRKLDNFSRSAFGETMGFRLLKNNRRGKTSKVKFNNQNCFIIWDFIQDQDVKIIYLCFFKADLISKEESLKLATRIMAPNFPDVCAALIPMEEVQKDVKPIFDSRVSMRQKALISKLLQRAEREGIDRAELLPIGTLMMKSGQPIIRDFIDNGTKYEIWLFKSEDSMKKTGVNNYIFLLRLVFFCMWSLVLIKVLITGRPLGISIENWLTLIFIVIGIVPLIVIYISGSFHLESSVFRHEQQAVKEVIRQFEEADASSEAILTEYRDLCRSLELKPEWHSALVKWDKDAWLKEIKKIPDFAARLGLKVDACYVYPPPVSNLDPLHYSFNPDSEESDASLADFYKNWVMKAYFNIVPEFTNYKDYEMPFFEGREGNEILRLFMGNRADSDFVDLGDKKQFFYQNYVLENGIPKNWFYIRVDVQPSIENSMRAKVMDWNDVYSERLFCLARIEYPDPIILLPATRSGKAFGRIKKHALRYIELAADSHARIFKKQKENMIVVFPCKKSGRFILTALITFRELHRKVFNYELILGVILILLCGPVIFVSRFISNYLVKPLKEVESGLKKIGDEDFSSRICLNRNDELGALSDAFDHMVDGIIERRNLGRFVSAGLDSKVAQDGQLPGNNLENSFGAVLCTDIRSFTTMSEKNSAREIVKMLNAHLSVMSACITKNSGMIEQFIGDAILAVFIADNEKKAAENAVKAAMEMVSAHKKLVSARKASGKFPYEIGVGIEAGKIMSGAIKAGEKNEYVLLGESRNKAEKLEAKSKLGKHSRIVCSDRVKSLIDGVKFVRLADNENWEIILGDNK